MKKVVVFVLVFIGITATSSFAQVTKLDFESTMTKLGVTNFTNIYLNNQKTFYTDGTNRDTYSTYDGDRTTVELTATSILLKYYSDKTKATLSGITIVPFSSLKSCVIGEDLSLDLKD